MTSTHNFLNIFPFPFHSSGARPALLMGVASEAMVGFLGGDHRLKIFFDLYFFDSSSMRDDIDMITFCNDLTGR
jgi:hypothetical protein